MDKQLFDLLEEICQQASAKTKKALVYSGNVEYICQTCANRKTNSKDSTENSSSKSEIQPSIASCVDVSPQNIPINPPTTTTSQTQTLFKVQPAIKVNEPPKSPTNTTSKPSDAYNNNHLNNQLAKNYDQGQQICYHYKYGRCRHGKTGKKIINGRECEFLHPQKCLTFCKFGNNDDQGFKGSCGLFHPKLCRNSVHFRQYCTFTHLVGTERAPKQTYSHDSHYNRKRNYQDPYHNNYYNENYNDFQQKGSYQNYPERKRFSDQVSNSRNMNQN